MYLYTGILIKNIRFFNYEQTYIFGLDINNDDRYFVAGGSNGKVILFDMNNYNIIAKFEGHKSMVLSVLIIW